MSKLFIGVLPLLLAFTLLLSTTVAFATPRDVQFHWAGTAINTLIENNIISGYEDGRFKPSKSITREEACVLLTRFALEQGLIQKSDLYTDNDIILADVKNTWSLASIQYMYRNNIMEAYPDGTFQPSTTLTRESMGDLFYKFYKHFGLLSDNVQTSSCPFTDIENSYARTAICYLYSQGVIHGYEDNTYRPENSVSRAEIATIILQISDLEAIAPAITLPNYKVINVPYISQIYPVSAIVGCEGTSLLMGLKSKGYAQGVGLLEFLNNLPRHASNPAKGFVASPFAADLTKKTRTTIYPPVLAAYGENYGNVDDFSGSTIDELQAELLDGNPVVVYATMHWEKPFYRYYYIEGTRQRLLSNNHVILACGYDKKNNMYYISDPYNIADTSKEYKYWIDGNTFERIYNERKQALVIQ
nr:S-layer homology domain-containing protein [uncultured Aminipila sp.]